MQGSGFSSFTDCVTATVLSSIYLPINPSTVPSFSCFFSPCLTECYAISRLPASPPLLSLSIISIFVPVLAKPNLLHHPPSLLFLAVSFLLLALFQSSNHCIPFQRHSICLFHVSFFCIKTKQHTNAYISHMYCTPSALLIIKLTFP